MNDHLRNNLFRCQARTRTAFFSLVAILLLPGKVFADPDNAARESEKAIVKAVPLSLDSVRLTGGPLKRAQEVDAQYLLDLQPDRMMAYLRRSAGLQPKAPGYGGWDGEGRQLTGHIAGHYLSAVSLMYAATGDPRFKDRTDYIVIGLKEIQQAQGDGYVGALMDDKGVDGKKRFKELSEGKIRSGGFDLNGLWSPWYVQHKLYAGLRDAYRYTGNQDALAVEIKFAVWAESVLAPLNPDQIQKMLNTEFGGMNEVLADLYRDTGDKRWLALADKFEHRAIVDPLAKGDDILAGKHGNTQVPKLLGDLMRYVYTGDAMNREAAVFFWDEVAFHHSFATGGHGKNEYFGKPDGLNDMVDGRTAETCNVYNMIKMARELFAIDPDIRYADFHERALFNHILASQDPDDGRVTYMLPVGRGVQHEYQDKFNDFTCCVGTGMESHALHGYGIYYESKDKLWVSLYARSTAEWKTEGVHIEMGTDFPIGDTASLKLTLKAAKYFTLALRRPYWAGTGFSVRVNGKALTDMPKPDSYVEIRREWQSGDTVELILPKTLRKEALPDNPSRMAFLWGPLVLAGDLGSELNEEQVRNAPAAPAIVTEKQDVTSWLKPVTGKVGTFQTVGVGLPKDVDFVPFYQLPRRRYAIYWDVFTPGQWKKQSSEYQTQQEQEKKLLAATVAFAQPGQMQSERDFAQQGEDSAPIQLEGRFGRQAKKWFSFDLPVDADHPTAVRITYSNDAYRKATFDILIDGIQVGEQSVEPRSPEKDVQFCDVEYSLPAELRKDKKKVTIRFEARENGIPGVFGIRTIRSDAPR